VTNELTSLIDRVRETVGKADLSTPTSDDRQKLLKAAQEFESMMLVQVFKDMRSAGKWDQDGEEDKSGFGSESLFEMADAELAGHFAKVQGLGLSKQLLAAFDRMTGVGASAPDALTGPSMPVPPSSPVAPTVPSLPELPTMPNLPVPGGAAAFAPFNRGASSMMPATTDAATASYAPIQRTMTSLPSSAQSESGDGSPTVRTVDGQVTSHFGWRRDPFTGQAKFHRGVDLAAVYGQDVQAARAGQVVFSGGQGGYGNTVVVEHADGTRTRYAHLSATLVAAGDTIATGQAVGRAGHSGRATGTHVHFEVTSADGQPIAPDQWLKKS
jgi:Rod binding domain-containing protein